MTSDTMPPTMHADPRTSTGRPSVDETRPPTATEPDRRVLFWPQAERDAQFRRLHRIFPSDRVARGAQAGDLPVGKRLVVPGMRSASAWLAEYMEKYHVAGVMVLEDGCVRLQHYALDFGPDQHWASFSMAKSVTSILTGVALKQGCIRGIDDTVDTYVRELRDSAYASVTVRQLLTMTSGVRWNEDYTDPRSDIAQKDLGAGVDGEARVVSYVRDLDREWPAGTHWHYNTAETDLLGIVVQRATHRSLASMLSQTVWQPCGMSADGYWIKDERDGSNTGGSGLSATLSDYARLGQFMLDGCRVSGREMVSRHWLDDATRGQADIDDEHRARGYHGYGYQWWINADGSYFAVGIFGQMIHLDPARRLVIVQLASWPHPNAGDLNAGRTEFVATISRAVDAGL